MNAFESVMAYAATPTGLAGGGIALVLLLLVRRSGRQSRRRTD